MSDFTPQSFATFGELLKHLRLRAHLTQDEFGLTVGYSRAHVARLESNQRTPDVSAVRARFIEALGLQQEPHLATRLIDLATAARDVAPPEESEASLRAKSQVPNNLPVQVTSFVGRAGELAALARLLPTTRLLTLTGSGGTGKTRLALQLAAEVLEDFPDGVWLVELAPVADPAFMPRAVAAVLGVHEEPGQPLMASLLDVLHGKHGLLILDNCEHLIDACAQFGDAVLHGGAGPCILATSREGLNIPGEVTWRVTSLQTPVEGDALGLAGLAQYEAMRLFVERARSVLPGFALTDANASAIRQIVARLDGIPLAIELAAARVSMLSPERIAERLSDRFRLLTGGSRTALPRQQTLRGAIDWSYRLLSEPERVLLRRLAVFVGGWTLEACEAVCAGEDIASADVLDLLTRLVDKSLVMMQAGENGGHERYRMLETIRQYARERLADTDEGAGLRDRHLEYLANLLDEAEPELRQTQVHTLNRLTPEIDNVRAALDWSIETRRIDDGLRLSTASMALLSVRGQRLEWLDWQRALLALPVPDELSEMQAYALGTIAEECSHQGMNAEAEVAARQALTLGLALGNLRSQLTAYYVLAETAAQQGDYAQAHAQMAKRRGVQDAAGISAGISWGVWDLVGSLSVEGEVWLQEGQYARAQQNFAQAVAMVRGDTNRTSYISRRLGYALLYQGDSHAAIAPLRVSLLLNAEVGDRQAVAACLAAFGAVALAQENLGDAARLYGASEATSESIHATLLTWDRKDLQRNVAKLREQLDAAVLNAAWAEGRAMSLERAVAFALQVDEADEPPGR